MDKIDAIVLKAAPYSETTLLVTLLTREAGVVRALAKGARRGGRNVQAAFEPFSWIRANLAQRDPAALGQLIAPEPFEAWDYLRRDLDRLAYAGLGIEVLAALAALSPPEPFFFEEACSYLSALGKVAGPGSLAVSLFLRLLHQAGYPPHLTEAWTSANLPSALVYHFDGGLLAPPEPGDPTHCMRLPAAAVAPLLEAFAAPPPLDGSLRLDAKAGPHALRWLIRVWEDHLRQPLKSAGFLEKMVLGKARPPSQFGGSSP
ncbi:MAG: DNA repair protein RecO [bacterium]|nr:DNA repair protein RecO [bacterium]